MSKVDSTSAWPGVRMNVSGLLKGIFVAQKGYSKAFFPIFSPITYYFCLWLVLPEKGGEPVSFSREELGVLVNTCIGRRNDYAVQRDDGGYLRAGRVLTYDLVQAHLAGQVTLGTYVIDEQGCCRFGVFDCDKRGGLVDLVEVQERLAADGIVSHLEASRRGGHLWVFLASLFSPAQLRRWLLPYCPEGMEFFPKQDSTLAGPGSLVRVPLGVHRLTGERYPFVSLDRSEWFRRLVPVASGVGASLAWLSTVQRVTPLAAVSSPQREHAQEAPKKNTLQKNAAALTRPTARMTIQEWCAQQDALGVIGRYVALDRSGLGCCPFGWHHSDGKDTHPSLWVHEPSKPGGACWYCHTWKQGGSVFDFLRLYYGLEARELWQRIQKGEGL
ncbi:zinc finger CHC2-family protein [Ktedonobacter racemifer DSM 44963]|uniref:Zinc finger CHC2-family protein n=1 Tax=Ktedonobacter racemifer DSM 44963 TaxID=485913 RepID=D6TKI6_KTERA|nr:zinc finger CHC2-family protein [Ktedonobacter racemifer DSM 44963]